MSEDQIDHIRHSFAQQLAQIARQWRKAVDTRLRPVGLTEATWLPLLYLSRAKCPMRQRDLAAALLLDDSSVVRLLDALQTSGLIERRDSLSDRRVKTLHLTDEGLAVIGKVEEISKAVRNELMDGLSDEKLTLAFEVLQHIAERLAINNTDNS